MTKLMFIFWSAAIVIPSPCRSECEFVTTFQEPFYEGELSEGRLYLVNPSTTDITVEVDTPLIGRTPLAVLNLDAKEQTSVTIPYSLLCNASGYSNKGIRIRSDDDIVVQAISLSAFGTSSWEVPPIEKLGRIHVLMTPVYATVPTNQGSYQILVVAPSAGTTVEVELNGPWDYRVEFDGINYNNSDMIYIELRQYQVAQIQCQQNDGCDMSGTVVISNRPVYVTSGTLSRSSLATSRLSNVISYVPPAERAGKEYIFTFAGVVKIFGTMFENETSVSISKPIGNTLIQESIHFAFQCKHYSVSASYCLIVDKPVLVSYLPEATSQENPNSFFLFLDAVDHRRSSDYTFATMDSLFGSCTYHLKLQVPTPAISGILIDERHGPWEWQALEIGEHFCRGK
ncbi:hypothetical protein LSH36_228g04003 [Paralvinella palmiformis]|uniref:IgGFc-binding protein N-terminal domain-containing protein n=1 Tax=Paralvinella palmiformis TaxID=53620 RepID=A0AAD9JMV4_9ANNE|nr:hypothetical protein LSH36_228g04003 [Paralvinella palmiformis]